MLLIILLRISTTPLREAGMPAITSTPTGSLMSSLRGQMETNPVGMRPRSPGSFARTQNPYTGAAAPAMGPASRVLSGNYQYPDTSASDHHTGTCYS